MYVHENKTATKSKEAWKRGRHTAVSIVVFIFYVVDPVRPLVLLCVCVRIECTNKMHCNRVVKCMARNGNSNHCLKPSKCPHQSIYMLCSCIGTSCCCWWWWLYDDVCNNFYFPLKSIWLFSLFLQMFEHLICFCLIRLTLSSHLAVHTAKRKSLLTESNRIACGSHNSLSIFNRQCRCQLKCRWLFRLFRFTFHPLWLLLFQSMWMTAH